MSNFYTVDEVFQIFKEHGLVSNIAVLRRWINSGRINANMVKRQLGYRISFQEVEKFLQENSLMYWKEKYFELEKENEQLRILLERNTNSNDTNSNVTDNVPRETLSNITKDDLRNMNRDNLRKVAQLVKLKGYSRMDKEHLLKELEKLFN